MEILKHRKAKHMQYIQRAMSIIACLYTVFTHAITPSFGKTHFIIGMQEPMHQELLYQAQQKPLFQLDKTCAYFAPDDNLETLLCSHIAQEQEAIDIAIYSFTNKRIALALIDAHNKGVVIRIVTDTYGLQDRFSKLPLLQEHNIPIFVYNIQYRGKRSPTFNDVMHNKFLIFKKNKANTPCVWTGSFNFTESAVKSNQENVVTIQDDLVAQKYAAQFDRLLQRCKKNNAR